MSRVNFCLISPHEENLLSLGYRISCKNHRHVSRQEALRLTGGGRHRPWLEEDSKLRKREQITFNYHPIAQWAILSDGTESHRHIVLRHAREWVQRNGSMQWVPLGGKGRTTGNRYKIHCKQRAPHCKVITK